MTSVRSLATPFRIAITSAALASATLLGACNKDDPTQPIVPGKVTAVAGASQTVTVGSPLPDSLSVLVASTGGQPVAGVQVVWSIGAGGGSMSSALTTTDAAGRTAIAYTGGTSAGPASVVATVNGLTPLQFDITLAPGAPSDMTSTLNDTTTIAVGVTPPALQVKVVDSFGNAIAGATVAWDVTDGGAGDVLAAATSTTDANGIATVQFTPDATIGGRVVTATTSNGVSFPLTIVVVPAAGTP